MLTACSGDNRTATRRANRLSSQQINLRLSLTANAISICQRICDSTSELIIPGEFVIVVNPIIGKEGRGDIIERVSDRERNNRLKERK